MHTTQSVDYVLVAEFDIDKGPTISHQYPQALSSDVKQLAELMLPDQTHVRSEDWTIFFLHFTPTESKAHSTSLSESQEPSLMYVLNLVNTKHDSEAKRGAQVKALAIVTRHSFLHVYKPLLLLALDNYYKNATIETLATVFTAANSMDLTGMPVLNRLERLILLQSDRDDLFLERFPVGQRERSVSSSSNISNISERMERLLTEPITPLLGPSSPLPVIRDTHHFNTSIKYEGITIPVAIPLTILPETVGDFSIIQLVNTFSNPSTSHVPQPNHPSLTSSGPATHPIIILLNALLTQKRVVLLGRGQPSGQVASQVLAACAMASGGTGLLRGFTERSFPYTDLSKIDDLLTIDGFIAGVTNSVFELHPEWWDVLCNLDTGQITISPLLPVIPTSSGLGTAMSTTTASTDTDGYDTAFIEDLLQSVSERASEATIRLKFRDYLSRFIRISQVSAGLSVPRTFLLEGHGHVWPDEAAKARDLALNGPRLEAFRQTISYAYLQADVALQYASTSPLIRAMDVRTQLDRLAGGGGGGGSRTTTAGSSEILGVMAREITTATHLLELLTHLSSHRNGGGGGNGPTLANIACGLVHPDAGTRRATSTLLDRVRQHPVGKHYYAGLNRFWRLAHERESSNH